MASGEKLEIVYPFKISKGMYEILNQRAIESDRTRAQHIRFLIRQDAEQHGYTTCNSARQAGVTDPLPAVEDGEDSNSAGG